MFTFAQKDLSENLHVRTPAQTPLHRILDPPQVGDWHFNDLSGSHLQSQDVDDSSLDSEDDYTTQVVEMSVTNNSLSKDYPQPDDHSEQITDRNITHGQQNEFLSTWAIFFKCSTLQGTAVSASSCILLCFSFLQVLLQSTALSSRTNVLLELENKLQNVRDNLRFRFFPKQLYYYSGRSMFEASVIRIQKYVLH